jgi:hypothetical protein
VTGCCSAAARREEEEAAMASGRLGESGGCGAFYTMEARVGAPCDLQWMATILGVRAKGTWRPSHRRAAGSRAGASRWRCGTRGTQWHVAPRVRAWMWLAELVGPRGPRTGLRGPALGYRVTRTGWASREKLGRLRQLGLLWPLGGLARRVGWARRGSAGQAGLLQPFGPVKREREGEERMGQVGCLEGGKGK